MKKENVNLVIGLSLIVLAVMLRILPHPDNFAPIAAIALFGGAILSRRLGLWVPVAAMMISDAIIGFHDLILVTWGCYLLIALAASYTLKKRTISRVVGLTLGSSLFFFAITNFAVWLWSGMYARTLTGLAECFTLALPFFRNTALSDLVYTGALFGLYALATKLSVRVIKLQSV